MGEWMHRLAQCQKSNFASSLAKLGFKQFGDCTFIGITIKIFRTNKTNSDRVRYWEVQDISSGEVYYMSNHCDEVLSFLAQCAFFTDGATMQVLTESKN